MHSVRTLLPVGLLLAATAVLCPSQAFEEGYGSTLRALPDGAGQVWVVQAPDDVVYFTGTQLVRDNGTSKTVLLTFPRQVFGAFTVGLGGDDMLFGESTGGTIWLVDASNNAQPRRLTTLAQCYDGTAYDRRFAMISARTGGPNAPNNEIWALDLVNGSTDLIAEMPGASGPLDADLIGNLVYASAAARFPPPPGSSDVLLFTKAKIGSAFGPGKLGPNDAATLASGLDSAGDLTIDVDLDIYVTDWRNKRIVQVRDGLGRNPVVHSWAEYASAPLQPASMQFMRAGNAPAAITYEPFQPSVGGAIAITESVFGGLSRVRMLEPLRPRTAAPLGNAIPPGPFRVVTVGGPAFGTGIMSVGIGPPSEFLFQFQGFDQGLAWSTNLVPALATVGFSFDAAGRSALTLVNPGPTSPIPLTIQFGFADRAIRVIGSANPIAITLR